MLSIASYQKYTLPGCPLLTNIKNKKEVQVPWTHFILYKVLCNTLPNGFYQPLMLPVPLFHWSLQNTVLEIIYLYFCYLLFYFPTSSCTYLPHDRPINDRLLGQRILISSEKPAHKKKVAYYLEDHLTQEFRLLLKREGCRSLLQASWCCNPLFLQLFFE